MLCHLHGYAISNVGSGFTNNLAWDVYIQYRLKYSWNEPPVLPIILSSIHRSLSIVSMKLNCLRFCHCVLQKGSMDCLWFVEWQMPHYKIFVHGHSQCCSDKIYWPHHIFKWYLTESIALQRKMEKSNTGIFSVFLQLYPGNYEVSCILNTLTLSQIRYTLKAI